MKITYFFYILLFITILSCSKSNEEIKNNISDAGFVWTVPLKDIIGTFNPFPLAVNPAMRSINNVEGLNDETTVAVVSFNEKINIYPLNFVQPFETVNDALENFDFTISYCPITESTINIDRNHDNQLLTFRASGILYKENLVMHDANSDSFWAQMLLKSIKGPFVNETVNIFPMIETSWKIAKTYFPDARVFTNKSIISSKSNILSKLAGDIDKGEKVFGYIDNLKSKNSRVFIYQYSQFNNGIQIYNSGVSNSKIVIGSFDLKFITAFLNENNYTFESVQNEFPIVMKDNLGNKWNAFGVAVSGPNKGEKLKPAIGFVASWWAWEEFYNDFIFLE